jgi:hypothetical protein
MKKLEIDDVGLKKIAEATQRALAPKKAEAGDSVWAMYDTLREAMGDTMVLEELLQAMSSQEAQENVEFIARMHDIPLPGIDEEEEEEPEEEEAFEG